MLTPEKHLDNLVHHIEAVRCLSLRLGKRLMALGRAEFGRILIARGCTHDSSKFFGIEWEYLHSGRAMPDDALELAIKHHRLTNPHHPEYWGGFENMPEISVGEMACDLAARSAEFGNDLREWIENVAVLKYAMDKQGQHYRWLMNFIDLLQEDCGTSGPTP